MIRSLLTIGVVTIGFFYTVIPAAADIAVIVHKQSPVDAISVRQAVDIFLGKTRKLPNGITVIPLDQKSGRVIRNEFYRRAANKSASQLKAYWARQVFTGQGEPPRSLRDDIEVKELVSENPNMIGYIDAARLDDTVKSVLLVK